MNPLKKIIVFDGSDLKEAFLEINELAKKYWIVGYIRYEAGYCFLPKIFGDKYSSKKPLMWFGVYEKPMEMDCKIEKFQYKPHLKIAQKIDFGIYNQKIQKIKDEIKKGNTYQVNFALEKLVTAETSDENFYLSLREQQKTEYSAFIRNEFDTILSFSPELFFEIDGNKINVKPMKGTLPRGKNKNEDAKLLKNIIADEKIKAENLMIVDLLRNDLGMIAKNGTVKIENLLQVETHSTLHQITSSVSAELKNLDYYEIFKALFPCGSVTGAPKIETMKIIKNLEANERDVYCGAIGYISPKKTVFSVPIRILQKKYQKNWIYKVGGGIVWDSKAKNEWKETETKTLFLQKNNANNFKLIETMLLSNNKIVFKKEHLNRLEASAKFFGFEIDVKFIDQELTKLEQETDTKKIILRLEVDKKGKLTLEKLDFIETQNKILNIRISDIILDKQNIFLRHKTSYRPWYENTKKIIKTQKIWDEIFINQDDEICEGSRSNIFFQINEKLFTPPLSSGVLNGILRQDLLDQKKCEEKIFYKKDLENIKNIEKIFIGNSVRGLIHVNITNP
jgi:para-aminobenzoate synthetase/4-amino-4-deoxychorismate lyase